MNNVYDESGTVIAMHPVQAAQHDAKAPNARGEWQGSHEDMAFYAFRYALGRRTYAVSDVAKYLTDNWSSFNANHRRLIHQEISEAIANNMAGDECDKAQWHAVLALPAAPDK